jgi:hypothetical protein
MKEFRKLLNLKDAELLQNQGYINDEWVDAKSGKRFDVEGEYMDTDRCCQLIRDCRLTPLLHIYRPLYWKGALRCP